MTMATLTSCVVYPSVNKSFYHILYYLFYHQDQMLSQERERVVGVAFNMKVVQLGTQPH